MWPERSGLGMCAGYLLLGVPTSAVHRAPSLCGPNMAIALRGALAKLVAWVIGNGASFPPAPHLLRAPRRVLAAPSLRRPGLAPRIGDLAVWASIHSLPVRGALLARGLMAILGAYFYECRSWALDRIPSVVVLSINAR